MQVEFILIKQRAILDVHGKFQKRLYTKWPEHLSCSVAVPHGVVKAGSGIVRVASFLQNGGRILILQQPVHPDSAARFVFDPCELRIFRLTLLDAVPGIDSVYAQLTTFPLENGRPISNILYVVGRCASDRMLARYVVAHALPEWNQEISRSQILLDSQIPFEWTPKVFRPPQINEGQRRGRTPGFKKTADRNPATKEIANCPYSRAVEKPKHRVVELVVANSHEVDVMG